MPTDSGSQFSVIVPVHNEAALLRDAVSSMVDELRQIGPRFELLICENGSTDASLQIARDLAARYEEVVVEHLDVGDYGLALKHAIPRCRHDNIVIFNLDFWSAAFTRDALVRLRGADVVIGSKAMRGATDKRPPLRRLVTRCFNLFLKVVFDFRGTDTHGMKALCRQVVLPINASTASRAWLFDTELVLRAERAGLRIVEIPVEISEMRPPSLGSIAGRVPSVLKGLLRLWKALRVVPNAQRSR